MNTTLHKQGFSYIYCKCRSNTKTKIFMSLVPYYCSKLIGKNGVQMKKLWSARNLVEGYREPCLLGVPVRVCGPASDWCGSVPPVVPPFNQHKTEQPGGGNALLSLEKLPKCRQQYVQYRNQVSKSQDNPSH